MKQPTVWLVIGDKAGDNAQLEVVRERLGWQVDYRRLTFLPRYVKGKPLFRASLRHVDLERSDPLRAPWPDIVFTIGRRPSMVALWIKAQSGGRTRVVLFGRPKRWLERFDLIVTPAQYAVPPAANVLNITLPLMRPDPQRLHEAHSAWQQRLARLPRPLIAVLVGGSTNPFRLDAVVARDLVAQASAYADAGTLYVTTSRRTPAEAAAALEECLPERAVLYRWGDPAEDNPYYALLAHADGFVVTGDSISMLTEVARLGRPLAVYALPQSQAAGKYLVRAGMWLTRAAPRLASHPLLERLGLLFFPRELTRIHDWLYEHGMAVPAGQPLRLGSAGSAGKAVHDELDDVVARIEALQRDAPTGAG
ncbi:MAG: ELM1/GtrOC1 family putative glycosyltransferase [Pseudomonadales bacterium]